MLCFLGSLQLRYTGWIGYKSREILKSEDGAFCLCPAAELSDVIS